jgi:hypothetical protein
VTEELLRKVGTIVGGFITPPEAGGLNSGKAVASAFTVGGMACAGACVAKAVG